MELLTGRCFMFSPFHTRKKNPTFLATNLTSAEVIPRLTAFASFHTTPSKIVTTFHETRVQTWLVTTEL